MSIFEFTVRASLRAKQLQRGAVPRIAGSRRATTTAQMEVAAGLIGDPIDWSDASAGAAVEPEPAPD